MSITATPLVAVGGAVARCGGCWAWIAVMANAAKTIAAQAIVMRVILTVQALLA